MTAVFHAPYQCIGEVRTACSYVEDRAQLIDCVYNNSHEVSERCGAYVLSLVSGACEQDAASLCSSWTKVDEIQSCLGQSMAEASPRCRENLLQYTSHDQLVAVMHTKNTGRLQLVATMTALYLLLMLCAIVWAWRNRQQMLTKQWAMPGTMRMVTIEGELSGTTAHNDIVEADGEELQVSLLRATLATDISDPGFKQVSDKTVNHLIAEGFHIVLYCVHNR